MNKNFLYNLGVLLIMVSTLFFGCTASRQNINMIMDSQLSKMDISISSSWLVYGMNKSLWRTKTYFERNPGAASYAYTYTEEVECRKELAESWLKMKKRGDVSNKYLDELGIVINAGFLNEYVWHYFRKTDWDCPDTLKNAEFIGWAAKNLVDHIPETMVKVSKAEETVSMAPSDQQKVIYRAMEEMNKGKFTKAELLLEKVVGYVKPGYQSCFESNDSLFCAFWDTVEMNQCVREHPEKKVIPMIPSYSRACFLLGYIAVELGNPQKAIEYLDKALKFQPDHPVILLEKGGVLAQLKKYQDAYEVFAKAEEPHYAATSFTLARALRGQGISLIDLGRLEEAELCLDKSLKYDPTSRIALNEIEYIRRIRSGQLQHGTDLEMYKIKQK